MARAPRSSRTKQKSASRSTSTQKLGRGKRYATGIDIGHFAVKILTLGTDDEGKIDFRKATVVPVPEANGAEYPEELHARQKEALKDAVKQHGRLEGRIALGFPRERASIRYVKLPSSRAEELREMLYYDVERHVPFPIDDLELSFEIVEAVSDLESRVMMVCAPTSEIEPYVQMCDELKIEIDMIHLNVAADVESYSKTMAEDETAALVNFGRSNVTIAIVNNKRMLFSRSLPITEERLLDGFAGAKTWKDLQGRVTAAGALNPREKEHFSQWVDQLGLELMRSMSAYMCEDGAAKIDKMILCGGAGYFPAGPPRGLTTKVKTSASIEPALNGSIPASDDYHPTILATSAGLALRALRKGEDTLNLLPEAMVQDRIHRQKSAFRKNIAVILFMIFMLFGAAGYLKWHERYRVMSEIDQYHSELVKATSAVQKMRKKINDVEHYLDVEQSCIIVLQKMFEAMPQRVWLHNVTFKKRGTLEISGQVETDDDVQQIMRNLQDLRPSPESERFFIGVQSNRTSTAELDLGKSTMKVREFQINCQLRWEEDKN